MKKKLVFAVLIMGLALSTLGVSQELPQYSDTPAKPKSVEPRVSVGVAQDEQFLAILHARDTKFAQVQELRRMLSFHDEFRLRIDRFLADTLSYTRPGSDKENVDSALRNLDEFERQ